MPALIRVDSERRKTTSERSLGRADFPKLSELAIGAEVGVAAGRGAWRRRPSEIPASVFAGVTTSDEASTGSGTADWEPEPRKECAPVAERR